MIGRIDRNRKIFASIFLLGYLSFVLLSVNHFHSFELSGTVKSELRTNAPVPKTVSESQDNCPVCHLFSSVAFFSQAEVISGVLQVESQISTTNEAGFQTGFSESISLRGPPSLNYFSI